LRHMSTTTHALLGMMGLLGKPGKGWAAYGPTAQLPVPGAPLSAQSDSVTPAQVPGVGMRVTMRACDTAAHAQAVTLLTGPPAQAQSLWCWLVGGGAHHLLVTAFLAKQERHAC
jgi:hypothetical protein